MGTVYTVPGVPSLYPFMEFTQKMPLSGDSATYLNLMVNNGFRGFKAGLVDTEYDFQYSYFCSFVAMRIAFYYDGTLQGNFTDVPRAGLAYQYGVASHADNVIASYVDTINTSAGLYGSTAGTTNFTYLDTSGIDYFDNLQELFDAMGKPITYRLTNCTAPNAPVKAPGGVTVEVPLVFSEGYDIVNPSSDVYVTNNGVVIPSQYSDGVITFTMPTI